MLISVRFAEIVGIKGQKVTSDASTVRSISDSPSVDVKVESFGNNPVKPKTAGGNSAVDKQESEEDLIKPRIELETFN